jgi:multiple sugar transport system ATP-binding protein
VEPTGSETQVHLQLAGQDVVGVFRERIDAKPGETLRLSPDPERMHLFDAGSGQRIPV